VSALERIGVFVANRAARFHYPRVYQVDNVILKPGCSQGQQGKTQSMEEGAEGRNLMQFLRNCK
jgi:hypothetical protein